MTKTENEITDIGFKRLYNKIHALPKGMKREFLKCRKCKARGAYDYTPFSLSTPLIVAECGHDFRQDYKQF